MFDKNKILILCKVVDNYGDIGVVYRLARALSDLRPSLEITLVVSNLESFHKLANQIDPSKKIQDFRYKNLVWKVVDWNLPAEGKKTELQFSDFNSQLILECFQCGRPEWLENILFAPDFSETVQIIQIDYLTAEDYADEFHLLKSGTRKANVKKIFFMPGFTEKTGGLIINNEKVTDDMEKSGASCLSLSAGRLRQAGLSEVPLTLHTAGGTAEPPLQSLAREFSIFFFAYDDDCSAVVKGISDFQSQVRRTEPDFSVTVHLASGKSALPFEEAWQKYGSPFEIKKIPFLEQGAFDEFILEMDFLFVRGEDSLSRAALSALPYVWQAYKQDENYQLVKVNALLERMGPFFDQEEFEPVRNFWQNYNDYENPTEPENLTKMLVSARNQKNTAGFKKFAEQLHQNGNLAEHLLEFIDGLRF